MALLTEQRWPLSQHGRVVTAVGVVTQSTVFAHRGVFPQYRPAFFGVAGVAGIVDAGFGQLKFIQTAVGIVTIRARHLTKPQRMTAGHQRK